MPSKFLSPTLRRSTISPGLLGLDGLPDPGVHASCRGVPPPAKVSAQDGCLDPLCSSAGFFREPPIDYNEHGLRLVVHRFGVVRMVETCSRLPQSILTYVWLLKLRIVVLLLFVSLGAAVVAANGSPGAVPMALLLVAGGMAAGGAGALNHYLEVDLDRSMERTRNRPLVSGRIAHPRSALGLGLVLLVLAAAIALPTNAWQGLFILLGAFIYVVVYTMWLKRRSAWNIIVGGAAGSCAVLSGWAAIGPWWVPEPLLMALLLFLWTPAHFWSLAIVRAGDYRRARVPMLPVVVGPAVAARWVLAHVVAVDLVSVILAVAGHFGFLFLITALAAGTLILAASLWLALRPDVGSARRLFRVSIVYLAAIFLGMVLDVYLG